MMNAVVQVSVFLCGLILTVYSQTTDECPSGKRVRCLQDPCGGATCPGMPGAICQPDYCDSCVANFYMRGTKLSVQDCQQNSNAAEPSVSANQQQRDEQMPARASRPGRARTGRPGAGASQQQGRQRWRQGTLSRRAEDVWASISRQLSGIIGNRRRQQQEGQPRESNSIVQPVKDMVNSFLGSLFGRLG